MAVVTLILMLIFTTLYLSKSLEKKPEFVTQAVAKITANLDRVSLWGAVYAVIAAILTMVMVYNTSDMFVRLVANIMVILMALPFVFAQLLPKYQSKMNPAVVEEARNVASWITRQEKLIGYIGAAVTLLLFAIVFR